MHNSTVYRESHPTRTIELDPHNAAAYYQRGNSHLGLRRYNEALNDYNRAIELDSHNASAYYQRGNTYLDLGQHKEALADYSRTIELDPYKAEAYYNRGKTLRELRRYKEALADYNQALALEPNDAETYNGRGNTYLEMQRYEEALSDYNRAIQLDPTLAVAYFGIGVVLYNLGRWQEALPYFEKAAQFGFSRGMQYALQIRQLLEMEATPEFKAVQLACEAFQRTDSINEMQCAVAKFPSMTDAKFIEGIEQIIAQKVPPEYQPDFKQRLVWLRQIANKQQGKENTP